MEASSDGRGDAEADAKRDGHDPEEQPGDARGRGELGTGGQAATCAPPPGAGRAFRSAGGAVEGEGRGRGTRTRPGRRTRRPSRHAAPDLEPVRGPGPRDLANAAGPPD